MELQSIAETFNKKYGDKTVSFGGRISQDFPRIPCGVFPVDFCLGGGLPHGRTSSVFGPPTGGKTTLAILYMIGAARICWRCYKYKWQCTCKMKEPLIKKSVLIDTEGAFDYDWACSLGLKDEDYVLVLPETGESAVDIAESCMRAEDCGFLVIDSLASLEPSVELDASAEDMQIGLQARLIAKLFRKVTSRIIGERKKGNMHAALFINQVRVKIGQHFGNPEDSAGGFAPKFAYSLAFRLGARRKENEDHESLARTALTIKKHKLRVLARRAEYVIAKENGEGYKVGDVVDGPTTIKFATDIGLIRAVDKKWLLGKKEFARKGDIITFLAENPEKFLSLKQLIIEMYKREHM